MVNRKLSVVAFTEKGEALAKKFSDEYTAARKMENFSLNDWTRQHFTQGNALVFVGAAGIAVRAISPFVHSKATDPAVISIDEEGKFIIPLLSGHLGGANELAKELAAIVGGTPIISTATDINGVFAVDSWARKQNLRLIESERIKDVSAKLLSGGKIGIYSAFNVSGVFPDNVLLSNERQAEVSVDISLHEGKLNLICPALTLGIGCKRGTNATVIKNTVEKMLREHGIHPAAIKNAASIDLKADEKGLLEFCKEASLAIRFFTAEELKNTEGIFSSSAFVEKSVGVDNVCERSAVHLSGGYLFVAKYAENGVTAALAIKKPDLNTEW